MRRSPNARRAIETTSWDVMPAGLSTSRSPSVEGLLVGGDAAITDLLEECLDASRSRDAGIGLKDELGREPEAERPTQTRAQMRGRALEPLERRLLLDVGAEHADEHLGMPEVLCDVDAGDRHEPDDARVLRAIGEKGRDLLADGFGDAVGA